MVDQVNDLIDPMEPLVFGAAHAPMEQDSGVEDEVGPPEDSEEETEEDEVGP